jgi:Zn-dependent peptidase ImmA (M78 family)
MNPKNLNTSLIKDLENKLGTKELLGWIDREAERLASLGRGYNRAIFFSKALMKDRNVAMIRAAKIVGNASIVPRNGRYLILFNRDLPMLPQRFAVAHEFGHTYWFAPGGEGRPLSSLQWNLGRDPNIERLCNRFAAALLLPKADMISSVTNSEPETPRVEACLQRIPDLAKKFLVAEQLVARRLFFEILQFKMALVCCRRSPNQTSISEKGTSWNLSWCALPNDTSTVMDGFSIPAKSQGRRVPTEMIPQPQASGACAQLNGKWWLLIRPTPIQEASKAFRNWPEQDNQLGYSFATEDKIYIALPLSPENQKRPESI